ncbi:MAG TPA: aspartate aminotransferase family protein [Alphaproteobacteria bacterium]|nr:aspartate aminotransferase family protein [Alphaproteobacteria bacterium]
MAEPIKPEDMTPLMPVYARADIYFERGEGCYLFTDKNERYLDFLGGIAVTGLGHAHPYVVQKLKEQAEKLWITGNVFKTHSGERLAKRLTELTFADTVFFQNSGVEAWECCVKVIRKYFSTIGQPQRYRVISFSGCFHGRTLAAIAAAKTEKMIGGFGPVTDGFDQVAWGNLNEVRNAITSETAAIMIEPVVGEGGMRAATPEFLKALRQTCDEFGLLLFFDEIQCGMGRTGKLFAHEWAGVMPDVMSVAKALGNGFPIGAALATAKAAQGMGVGTHGSTYGGNPLATEVGNAVLDVMTKPGFLDDAKKRGDYFAAKIAELPKRHPKVFTESRGKGLMQGLVCVPLNTDMVKALRDEKLLCLGAGDNVVRFLPPLIVTEAQIDEAIAIIDRVAARMAK